MSASLQPDLLEYIKKGFSKCLNNHERQLM